MNDSIDKCIAFYLEVVQLEENYAYSALRT